MSMVRALVPQLCFSLCTTHHTTIYNLVSVFFFYFKSIIQLYHFSFPFLPFPPSHIPFCSLFFLFVLLDHIFTCTCIFEYKPLRLYNTTCTHVFKTARLYGKQKVCFPQGRAFSLSQVSLIACIVLCVELSPYRLTNPLWHGYYYSYSVLAQLLFRQSC